MWACFEATYSLLKQDTPDYIHGRSSPPFCVSLLTCS